LRVIIESFVILSFVIFLSCLFPNFHLPISSVSESYSFLCSHSCVYLSFVQNSLNIFCSAGLMIMNSFSFYHGIKKFFFSVMKDSFAGYGKVDSYFLSGPHPMDLLRNFLLFWWVCFDRWLGTSFFCRFQYHFLFLYTYYFNYNMIWRGSFLVMSVWCSKSFLNLGDHLFLKNWEVFYYDFIECLIFIFLLCLSFIGLVF
jgi:hypothetical protein